MPAKIIAFSGTPELQSLVDAIVEEFNKVTGSTTTRSSYIRLAVEERARRDAGRLAGYRQVNATLPDRVSC